MPDTASSFASLTVTATSTTQGLDAIFAHIASMFIGSLSAAAASISNLVVTTLSANNAMIANLTTTNATTTNLYAASAIISSLAATNVTSSGFFDTSGITGGYLIDHNLVLQSSSTLSSLFVGQSAGNSSMTGTQNTAIGYNSLNANTSGNDNTVVGSDALALNTAGFYNTAIGQGALHSNTAASYNTAVGMAALEDNTTGSNDTAIGQAALFANTTGSYNSAFGQSALNANTTGANNNAFGAQALYSNTTGSYNTGTGQDALFSNTTGYENTSTGVDSLFFNTTGYQNTATGHGTLFQNTTGNYNTADGESALFSLTTGSSNTAIGQSALYLNTDGWNNTANGAAALENNTSGSNNSTVGFKTLVGNTSGSDNTALGFQSGSSVTTGGHNIFIGANVDASQGTDSQKLNIGNVIFGSGMYAGAATSSLPVTNGMVGILNSAPSYTLDVNGSAHITQGLDAQYVVATSSSIVSLFNGGLLSLASSTVGNGTQAGGLTINGGATTTGYIAITGTTGTTSVANGQGFTIGNSQFVVQQGSGKIGIGTTSPYALLSLFANGSNTNGNSNLFVIASSTGSVTTNLFSIDNIGNATSLGNITTAAGTISGSSVIATNGMGAAYIAQNSNVGRIDYRGVGVSNTSVVGFSASNSGAAYDGALSRISAGKLAIGNGTQGDFSGTLVAGMVGIGTSNPYSRLQVTGPDAASTSAFTVVNNASTTAFAVYDNGNATYAGSIFQSSDERLKSNVQTLDASSSLSEVMALNPVSYTRIDQPGTTQNLGFLAQAVRQVFPQLIFTTAPTALTPDGTLTLNYSGLIAPIVAAVQAVQTEVVSIENAIAGFAQSFASNSVTAHNQLCVGSTCVTPAQFQAMVAAANQTSASAQTQTTSTTNATATPPVIQVNGTNPATIQVGTTYSDLGATITGPAADLNLGIQTFVNGVAMSPVVIDTSVAATDTISYVVTDQNGLTSTSTRTVIIQVPPTQAASSSDQTAADVK